MAKSTATIDVDLNVHMNAPPDGAERRAFAAERLRVERRGEDDPPRIAGYAAVFDVEGDGGWFREVIRPGAFRASLQRGDDVRAFFNHDISRVLGRRSSGTLSLSEDSRGLKFEIAPPATSDGADAIALIERGDVSGMSFGFRTVEDRWGTKDGVDFRELLEVDLIEVSPVVFPFYDSTTAALRSVDCGEARQRRDRWRRRLDEQRRRRELDLLAVDG